jgi:hypothetical protein
MPTTESGTETPVRIAPSPRSTTFLSFSKGRRSGSELGCKLVYETAGRCRSMSYLAASLPVLGRTWLRHRLPSPLLSWPNLSAYHHSQTFEKRYKEDARLPIFIGIFVFIMRLSRA